jgi:hypothetical protein
MAWSLACTGVFGEGEEAVVPPVDDAPTDVVPVEGEEPEAEPEEGGEEEEGDGEDLFDTGDDEGGDGGDGGKGDDGEKGDGGGKGDGGDKGDDAKKGKKPEGGGGGKAKSLCLVATGPMTASVRMDLQAGAVTGGEVTYTDTKSGSTGAATNLTGKKTGSSVKASGKGTVDGKAATIEVEISKTDDAVVLKIDGKAVPKAKKKPCG